MELKNTIAVIIIGTTISFSASAKHKAEPTPPNNLCSIGQHFNVEGSLKSTNISQLEQEGKLKLKLIQYINGEKEAEYSGKGTSYGQIINPGALPPEPTLLNHIISLKNGRDTIITQADQAYITGVVDVVPGTSIPCAFSIEEYITSMSGSTGVFTNATGMVKATGTINSCPQNANDEYHNSFTLSGYVCLQED